MANLLCREAPSLGRRVRHDQGLRRSPRRPVVAYLRSVPFAATWRRRIVPRAMAPPARAALHCPMDRGPRSKVRRPPSPIPPGWMPSRSGRDATPSAEPGSPDTTPAGRPVSGAGAPPGSGPQVDRDTLVLAWGDQVVETLPAKAKALFGGGHFVSVTDGVATFALPSDPLRDRCEELRAVVEDAIATAVGTRLALRLIVEGRPRPAARTGRSEGDGVERGRAAADNSVPLGHYEEDEDFDPDDPGEPVEIESVAQARLLEVFPGAQEVID